MVRRYVSAATLGQGSANASPLNDERPSGQAEAFRKHEKAVTPYFTDMTAERKAEITAAAKEAMAGFELVKLAGGSREARRWGMAKLLATIADVEAWLNRAGGRHA
jgi:hypothetical protein